VDTIQIYTRLTRIVCGLILLLIIAGHHSFQTVQAATIPVACETSDLIDALNTANGTVEEDLITLEAGCTYTLNAVDNTVDGPNGLPSITSDIVIQGNGATIERSAVAPNFRILHISAGALVTLDEVTIRGGQTGAGFPDGSGAGIFNRGDLRIFDSWITENTSGNSGAGIYNYSASISVERSTVSHNSATGDGGGLQNDGATAQAIAQIANSTFAANSATGGGGALFNAINSATAHINVTNVTLVGNSASSGAVPKM
jgi:autotransporter family porin